MPPIGHNLFSASSAHRWLECPGSVPLSEQIPPAQQTIYAAEGTCAHEIAEFFLKNGLQNDPYEAVDIDEKREIGDYEIKVTKEMVDAAVLYAETIFDDCVKAGLIYDHPLNYNKKLADSSAIRIETKVIVENTDKQMGGTVDCCVEDAKNKKITIYDFKYGKGIPVEVEGNQQLLLYAVGYIHEMIRKKAIWTPETIELCIIQPRAYHDDGPIRRATYTFDWIVAFQEILQKAYMLHKNKKDIGVYHSGEHCRFCPAKHLCSAFKNQVNEGAQMMFAPIATEGLPEVQPNAKELTSLELSEIMKKIPAVEAFIESIREQAYNRLNNGEKIPGFKLVKKRANRKWIDEDEVICRFGVDACEQKIKTPAQMEKAGFDIEGLVMTPDNGVTVVPESDKRESYVPIQELFNTDEQLELLDI